MLWRIASLLLLPLAATAEPAQKALAGPRYVGAAGCKSSSCHGGAGEEHGQYFTWLQKDFHTHGYAILTNARSQRIAAGAGLGAAQESNRCTICHSPFQAIAPARLAKTVDPRESISCESCHGAAESWLRGHTRKDWNYATRIGAGMRDLKSFYVRANTCVACHQNIDRDLVAAGHPELVFELDGQSVAEPKHWRDLPGSGARAWLVGQAVALREVSWQAARSGTQDEGLRAQWEALRWLLAQVTAAESALPRVGADESFAETQRAADALARRAAELPIGEAVSRRIFSRLTSGDFPADAPRDILFRRAQRLVLALECLSAGPPSAELRVLREELRNPIEFDPERFRQKLAALRVR